jgi:hypothetical protein
MTQPTKDELLQRLADAQQEQESVTAALIWLELDELRSSLGGSEARAAERLRAAHDALEAPLGAIAAIDRDIAQAEGRCVEWQAKLEGAGPDQRAQARIHFQEWDAEVTSLRAKRDQAEAMAQPVSAEHDQARKALEVVQAAKTRVLAAMLNPFGDELAQATEAYKSIRMTQLVPVLLRGDRSSAEWDMAVSELAELQRITENPRWVPEVMASAAETPPDPAPSMGEVLALDKAVMENMTLQQQANVVEDHRRPGPPRQVPERPFMEVPKLRDMGLR